MHVRGNLGVYTGQQLGVVTFQAQNLNTYPNVEYQATLGNFTGPPSHAHPPPPSVLDHGCKGKR